MSSERLGKLQLSIMRVLWQHGECTATEVHRVLEPSHHLAPTTIATMLRKMESKGVVTHRADGRRFLYAPTVSAPDVTHSMVADLAERLFGGDVAALACHLIEEHEVGAADLDDLRRRIDTARKERRR